jgi:hypothetical protein
MSRFPWSPVTVERLLILRAEGLKLSSIAAELGTTTYAIEHKLRRLRGRKPAQASQVMSRFPWSPVTVERLLILQAQGLRLSRIAAELGTTTYAIEHKLRRLRGRKPAQASQVPAVRLPLPLFDLRPRHCRWIVSGSGTEALFCGQPRVGSSPYCVEHTQRAWQRSNREAPARPTARRSYLVRRR